MLFAVANQAWTACNVSLSSFPSSPLIRYNSRGHSDSHRGAVSAVLALYHVSTWVRSAESTGCSKLVTFPAAGKNSRPECALGSQDGDALSIHPGLWDLSLGIGLPLYANGQAVA